MGDKFSITITAKARHGKLWELRKKFGTTVALAKYLGISQGELGQWLNLNKKPPIRMSRDRIQQIEAKGLRKLRHPSRSNNLRNFLNGIEDRRYINATYFERYVKQSEIVFVDRASVMGSLHSVSVSSKIEMFDGFVESGSYVRIYI